MIEKNFKINKRQIKKVVILFIGLIILLKSFELFMFSNTKIIYGKITRETNQAKGGYSTRYSFECDNKIVEGSMPNSDIKDISLDSLKKLDSIKIEVSNYSTFFNRIIDKRVLDE